MTKSTQVSVDFVIFKLRADQYHVAKALHWIRSSSGAVPLLIDKVPLLFPNSTWPLTNQNPILGNLFSPLHTLTV